MSSSIDSRAGARHGSYILGDRLAAGGMAEVFTAQSIDRHFDTPIVVKRMLPHLARDRSFVAMFIDEARLSTRLDHPNIVKVYEFEATGNGLSLVMELIDGPDLLAVLKRLSKLRRRMPAELAVFIVCHVLEALDYAHTAEYHGQSLEVIHRDVSPSNVLLSRRGNVKLADFGIARAAKRQQETATGTLKGKYAYMSPEQVLGDDIDGRSDIFSTAIVLAEMLMGHRLFSAASDLDVLLKVRRADLSRLDKHGEHIDPGLDTIVRRALARDPARRYQTAGALRDALSTWLTNTTARASAKHLAEFLSALEQETGNLCKWRARSPQDRGSATTISGTETRLARIQLRKAAVAGREVFALGGSTKPAPQPPDLVEDLSLDPRGPGGRAARAPTSSGEWDLDAGDLETVHLFDLLCEIGHARRTGLLRLVSGERVKELYFTDGKPEFVRSNVPSDRFGQFLLHRGVLSQRQLGRVLAALPHFKGRMGQALVSLGLLAPVDAIRLLSEQIEHKIVDACCWRRGGYTFSECVRNPWPALTLELDTLRIVGRNLASLPRDRLAHWARRHRTDYPVVDVAGIDAFGFDARTARLMRVFLGKRSLEQILEALPSSVDTARFVAAAYVLARANVLSYGTGDRQQRLPERRKFRRVAIDRAAELEAYQRGDAGPIAVQIRSITCTGMGLRFAPGRFCRLRRGERIRMTFHTDRLVLTLQGKVAWCTSGLGGDLDFGVELDLALVPAATREHYAGWVVDLLERSR